MGLHALMVAIENVQPTLFASAKATLHARKSIRYKILPLIKCLICFVLNFTLIKLQYEPIAQSFPRRRGWLECAAGVCGAVSSIGSLLWHFFFMYPGDGTILSAAAGQPAFPSSAKAGWNARRECVGAVSSISSLLWHFSLCTLGLAQFCRQQRRANRRFPRRQGWLEYAAGVRGHEFLLIKRLNMPFIPYISWNLLGFAIMRTGQPALSTSAEAGKHSESGRHGFLPIICLIMQFFLYIFWNLQRSEVDGASGMTQTASCSKATLLAFGKDASKGASGFAFRKV